ncbi:hypothetical protein [Cohnella sp. GbtcB17]|uniref:hypothetical protein n=1 Tax=Cohnella sp. GbtcB17 TaxID=2824762 RepID=UPI001C30416D|nr:hypothetical protein [Cohnella sp. GbtcB17]
MLPDKERKVLRILAAYTYKHKRFPSMWELWRKTGSREADLVRTLKALVDKGFIEWDQASHHTSRIIKEWEDGVMVKHQKDSRALEPWEMASF